MRFRLITLSILTLLITSQTVYSQCSDAGICFIGGKSHEPKNEIGMTYIYGKSDKASGLTFQTVKLLGNVNPLDNTRFSFELPYSSQGGKMGNVSGVGDIGFLVSHSILKESDYELSIQGGMKLATANVNSENLPQVYQSGLGTNDVLIGVSSVVNKLSFSVAYQVSRGRSENKIDKLMRGDDIMLRGGYSDSFGEFNYSAELIALKRLHLSSVADPLNPNQFIDLPGSDQFQVDFMAKVSYPILSNFNVGSVFAIPFLKRKINVDGLTRSFTLSIGGFYSFNL
jgi:hypothetical protein